MKVSILILMASLTGSVAFAKQECSALALTAAKRIYQLSEDAPKVVTSNVKTNLENTSNGVSLIVTLNETVKYLVLLSQSEPQSSICNSVDYVISYPYAKLIKQ